MTRRDSCDDRGAATVLVLGLCTVVLLAGTVAAALGAVAVARHRAASAADLAALAAAARVLEGSDAACAAAARTARAAGATVRSCRVEGWEAVVEAAVVPPGAVGRLGTAVVAARAGPAGWSPGNSRRPAAVPLPGALAPRSLGPAPVHPARSPPACSRRSSSPRSRGRADRCARCSATPSAARAAGER